jgi:hypothetical protein
MECVVEEILPLGEKGGAGNLIVCRIVLMHIHESILTESGRIDPHKIDLMGRMGRFYYARASGSAVYEIAQPVTRIGIGFDHLPPSVRHSAVLTGNNLAELAALTSWPTREEMLQRIGDDARTQHILGGQDPVTGLQRYAKEALDAGDTALGAALAALSAAL